MKVNKLNETSGKVFAGVVVYKNDKKQVLKLIESLRLSFKEAGIDFKIVIWCNDLFLWDFGKDIRVYHSDNFGFGFSHNKLMEIAFNDGFDYYLCINPDGFLHYNAITELLDTSQRFNDKALVEAAQVPAQHPKPFDPITLDTPWVSGACFLIPKAVYSKIGGFDDSFFMYCEDVDISWRAKHAGFFLKFQPKAMFYHDISGRKRNIVLERQLMLSGRYLGKKWSCEGFSEWVEEAMLTNGLIKDKRALPKIKCKEVFPCDTDIVEFRNTFSFSFARW